MRDAAVADADDDRAARAAGVARDALAAFAAAAGDEWRERIMSTSAAQAVANG
jgi:hypothetical protein